MMKARIFPASLLAVSLAGASAPAFPIPRAEQKPAVWAWRPVAEFGGPPLFFGAAFTIGEKAYIGTGYGLNKAFWQYDPAADVWTQKSDFAGTARGAAVAFSVGGKGYIGLGWNDAGQCSDLWEYDPAADRWASKAALPSLPRDHAGAFVIGSNAYIFGGTHGDGETARHLKEVWEYNPRADRWARKADLPESAAAPAVFVLNGKGYFATGILSSAPQVLSRRLWEYDPRRDAWTRKADFPGAGRFRAVGFAVGSHGYLGIGIESIGETSAVVFDDLWEYNPVDDAWTKTAGFAGPARGAAVAFALGSSVFIGTGTDSNRRTLRDFWQARAPAGGERKPDRP